MVMEFFKRKKTKCAPIVALIDLAQGMVIVRPAVIASLAGCGERLVGNHRIPADNMMPRDNG